MSWRARLSHVLEEVRFVYSPKSSESSGVRNFIASNYEELKLLNPGLPIYVRCCEGVKPFLAIRLSNGFYESASLAGLEVQADIKKTGVERALQHLLQKSEEKARKPILGSKSCSTARFADII
eukprot:jgi/Galph1/861/GphlegSOOS_G5620.1